MIQWPFRAITTEGWTGQLQDGFLQSPEGVTPLQRRRTFNDIVDYVDGSTYVDEYSDFIDFYTKTTRSGTLPFEYYDATTKQTRVAYFVGNPTYASESGVYKVNMTLELSHLPVGNSTQEVSQSRITEYSETRLTEDGQERYTE